MRSGKNTARKHHYVPQWYLRGFVQYERKPKLAVIDLLRDTTFTVPPDKVASERDFHTIDIEGHAPDDLEKAFAMFDAEASLAFQRIAKAGSIKSDEDFVYATNLMSLMAAKNPRGRAEVERVESDVFRLLGQALISDENKWNNVLQEAQRNGQLLAVTPEKFQEVKDFIRRDEYDIHVPTTRILQIELAAQAALLQALGARHWSLLRAPAKSPGFVTSDHPVCLLPAAKPRNIDLPLGFGFPYTEVVFTLNRRLAVAGSFERRPFETTVSADEVAYVNGMVIAGAHHQVYSGTLDFEYKFKRENMIKRGRELLHDRFTLETRELRKRPARTAQARR